MLKLFGNGMDRRMEERTSIPRFGGWGEKGSTNYSVVFSRARDRRKQCKTDVNVLMHNDHAFVAASTTSHTTKPDSHSDEPIQVINHLQHFTNIFNISYLCYVL
ncbi:hypothetical protein V6N12_039392 [Hibiscus sabdariffa]|uniref:RIN4 pathogenic type III effector avirulence factor Avr cleavage site domain-containing protein n=1 Tax=Hibiscus sabdariffa TaxID=183260 RepID=A0ABR2E0L0_9ROSI